MGNPKVFISYSHDSPEHSERVLALAWALRGNGIDVELDQFHNEEIVDWPRWCDEQCGREHSDFVLCVCTTDYKRRIEGKVPPEKGKGVHWEGRLLDDDLYDEKGNSRLVPILFDDEPESSIPRFLRGWTRCGFRQFAFSDSGYEHLIRILTGQAKMEKNPLGSVPVLPTKRAPTASHPFAQTDFKADISRILKYAPAELIGREAETQLLNDAWAKVQNHEPKRPHILIFVALGGEGKTSLVAKWAAELAHQDWPGCDAAFAWSCYSQGTREQVAASSDLFLKEAITFFGDDADKQFAASAAGAYEKGQRLARIVGQRRRILILDGLEPLQYAPTSPTPGQLKDQGIAALLKGLAAASHGLCVVTTRYSLPDLRAFWQATAPEVKLLGLSRAAGVHLLQSFEVKGSLLRNIPFHDGREQVNEFEKLVEDVQGHALTLNLLGTYLRDAHAGDIRKRDLVKLEEADAEEQGGHAFRVMDAYARWFETGGKNEEGKETGRRALALLELLGLFDRPATVDCLTALWEGEAIAGLTEPLIGLSEAHRNLSLTRLEGAKLLTVNRDEGSRKLIALDTHALLGEYFARRVREKQPAAWRTAHRRLYEYLCATTPDKTQPTLEELQPLYQAVAHGCQAGLHQEAYDGVFKYRILRPSPEVGYSWRQLGAIGTDLSALACFFDIMWSNVSPSLSPASRGEVLGLTGVLLGIQGRFDEAGKLLNTAYEHESRDKRSLPAGKALICLCDYHLFKGDIKTAISSAKDARSLLSKCSEAGSWDWQMRSIFFLAHAYHQWGDRRKARARFELVERKVRRNPQFIQHPELHLVGISQYCDLLLDEIERRAWQRFMGTGCEILPQHVFRYTVKRVIRKAEDGRKRADGRASIHVGLSRLAKSRAALYGAILHHNGVDPFRLRNVEAIDEVVRMFRANAPCELPVELLTRAWVRFVRKKRSGPESAQSDLDEAWEIAERGPMPLFLADIHLHRARLFFREAQYPWASPQADLAAAEKLINDCGYHRRDEELADAKAAILSR